VSNSVQKTCCLHSVAISTSLCKRATPAISHTALLQRKFSENFSHADLSFLPPSYSLKMSPLRAPSAVLPHVAELFMLKFETNAKVMQLFKINGDKQ